MTHDQFNKRSFLTHSKTIISYQEVIDHCFDGNVPEDGCTLLFGYTCNRESFHVYISPYDELLHLYVYNTNNTIKHIASKNIQAYDLHPNKRVYPSLTLFTFYHLLVLHGENPTFTTFDESEVLSEENPSIMRETE